MKILSIFFDRVLWPDIRFSQSDISKSNDRSLGTKFLHLAAAVIAVTWIYLKITYLWDNFPDDLSAVYMAGWLVDNGRADLVYSVPNGFFGKTPDDWKPFLETLGVPDHFFVTPYVYPPLWAIVISPVCHAMDMVEFFRLSGVVFLVLLVLSVWLAWRIVRPATLNFPVWLLLSISLLATSSISSYALTLMQPQIAVTFICLLAFERYGAGNDRVAALLLALAAAIKLTPAALAVLFLMDRNWRALGFFIFGCLGLALAGWIVAGPQMHSAFFASLKEFDSGVLIAVSNWSVEAAISGLLALAGYFPDIDPMKTIFLIPSRLPVVVLLCRLLALAALIWLHIRTRNLHSNRRLTVRLLCVSLLVPLFGPIGWTHYYLLPLLLIPSLASILPQRIGLPALVAIGIALSQAVFFYGYKTFTSGLSTMIPGTVIMLAGFILCLCVGTNQSSEKKDAQRID